MTREPAPAGADRESSATVEPTRPGVPELFGHRVTDLSAVAGAACWLALALGWYTASDPTAAVSLVEVFVAFALLVLVPLGLGVAASPRDLASLDTAATSERVPTVAETAPAAFGAVTVAQLPAALGVVAALALPQGSIGAVAFALPWLALTGTVALVGLLRLVRRRVWPVSELAVDAALLYLPVGAVALLLHQAGISLQFQPIIVLLTAIHYHYAGFVLPLVVGRVARVLDSEGALGDDLAGRATTAAVLVLVANLALIAVGITFSATLEMAAVVAFAAAVLAFAASALRRAVPVLDAPQSALLAVAFGVLFWTMALAVAYAYSAFPATGRLISIGEMVTRHGVVNAFGFALAGLVALRLRDSDD